jgi:hypothetical protein
MADDARLESLQHAARLAYERGRLTWAMKQALAIAAIAGVIGFLVAGRAALPWLPLPFVAWTFAAHRGGAFQAGALRGLVAGVVTLLVPLAWLRPCCAAGAAGESCCAAPGMCTVAGMLLGASFALLLPRAAGARRVEAAAGLMLGAASVGMLRCQALLIGEGLGLLAGLSVGLLALGATRALLERAPR